MNNRVIHPLISQNEQFYYQDCILLYAKLLFLSVVQANKIRNKLSRTIIKKFKTVYSNIEAWLGQFKTMIITNQIVFKLAE